MEWTSIAILAAMVILGIMAFKLLKGIFKTVVTVAVLILGIYLLFSFVGNDVSTTAANVVDDASQKIDNTISGLPIIGDGSSSTTKEQPAQQEGAN